MIENNDEDNKSQPIEDQILDLLRKNPEGVNHEILLSTIEATNEDIVEKLSYLLEANRVYIYEKNGEQLFKYRSEKEASKFADLSPDEIQIYMLIADSVGNGVSTNEIKIKLKFNTSHLNKILNKLEKKLLIKSLKMLNQKNRKLWFGFDIEPNQDKTGGPFCTNQEFDKNLVELIKNYCLEYMCGKKFVTRKEIIYFINSLKIVGTEIKDDDIQKIINILIFDDKIEVFFPKIAYNVSNKMVTLLRKNESSLNQVKYKLTSKYEPKSIINSVPCTYCPVFRECQIDNVINPKDCPYMTDFIKLF